jgi:hypothetical protein
VGFAVKLEDENGRAIETVVDPRNLLHQVLEKVDESSFPWAATVDWYDDTTFNHLQAERLQGELARLLDSIEDPETRSLLQQIDGLLTRCISGIHMYVKFWGD